MTEPPSFELTRFAWATPDQLDVSGVFNGLDGEQPGAPALVVRGSNGEHRLPAVSVSGDPADGARWTAAFAWQEVPDEVEDARLEFEGGLRVELPPPATEREPVRVAVDGTPAEPATAIGMQAALLAAEEEVREWQTTARQAEAELARVSEDLATERQGRAADAERFREALEKFRASAEAAVGEEASTREALESQLAASRERIAELERGAAETDAVRLEAENARGEAENLRTLLDEVRADADRLVGHLAARSERSTPS
jgi:hypothetical protein